MYELKKIADRQSLELKYKKGFGAWTYHLVIPNTAYLEGKWGDLKVSGFIDHYKLEVMNLAPRKNEDKIISINKDIRKALGKTDGDLVIVTLFLHTKSKTLDVSQTILDCFKDAGVLNSYAALGKKAQREIIQGILSQPNEDKLVAEINRYIQQWVNSNT